MKWVVLSVVMLISFTFNEAEKHTVEKTVGRKVGVTIINILLIAVVIVTLNI